MKFNVDFQGVKYNGEGNFATEETLAKLLAAYNKTQKPNANPAQKAATNALNGLADSAEDAGDGLGGFSDELETAEAATKRAADKLKTMGDKASDAAAGLFSMGEGGFSLSNMISKVGDLAGDSIAGIGKLIPVFGDGVGELGKVAATAAVGLVALSVSMIESYKDLNKEIINSGLVIRGGFDSFSEFAEDSGIPLQEFSSALMANSKQLRLMSGGAPGGIKNISAAFKDMGTETRGMLYSLGYSTEDIVSSMAEYSIQAQKSGKQLTSEELANRTSSYLKNLTELSRLTGVSAKEAQAKVDADRNNLFIQSQLLNVNEEQRQAAAGFIGSLSESMGPMRDFIVTGQSYSAESANLVSQFPTLANIMRQTYEDVASGSLTQEQANRELSARLQASGAQLDSELTNVYRTFGVAPEEIMGSVISGMGDLGVTVQEMSNAAMSTVNAAAGEVVDGSLQDTFGTFETTVQSAATLIQGTFIDSLELAAPALNGFIGGVGDMATSLTTAKESIGDFLSSADPDKYTELFTKISDTIGDGLVKGFDRVLLKMNPVGAYSSDKINPDGTVTEGYGTMASAGLKTVELGLDAVDIIANGVNAGLNIVNPLWWAGITDGLRMDLDSGTAFQDWANSPSAPPEPATPAPNRMDAYEQQMNPLGDGFSRGGVAKGPASGYAALLHGTEAVVPLPDGKSIPVDMSGLRTALEAALTPDSDPAEVANAMDELASTFSLDSSKIIDGSRTMPELLQINKALLQQYFALNEKFERMVKAMEDGNNINRSSAFARA